MSAKLSFAVLFIASLSCFGQVVSTGGYATTAGSTITPISAANAPLIATPDVALPGSGPAVGSPLGSSNSNDSRIATGPSVYNPNTIVLGSAGAADTTSADNQTSPNGSGSAAASDQGFEFGVQQVESSTSTRSGPVRSLGEIAREFRAQRLQPAMVINNDSVARLNASRSGMGNLSPRGNDTVAGSAQPAQLPANEATLLAQNQTAALPQSDQEQAPEPAASPTAGQQRHASDASPTNQNSAPAQQTAQAQSSNPSPNSEAGPKLPQTASHLPLILLIGGLGVAGGILYLLRR